MSSLSSTYYDSSYYLKSLQETYKTYTITAIADPDNNSIKRSFANVDGIIYGETAPGAARAGGIIGQAGNDSNTAGKSVAKGLIAIANNISAAKTSTGSNTAESGYIAGRISNNSFEFNAAYYNNDVLSNGITNTTGTPRSTSLLKIPSFLTGLLGLNAYESLDKLTEDETAVWVIKNGELPELYYNCLRDITISDDIENGTITADKAQGIDDEVVEITAVPDEGYVLNKAYVNGEEIVGTTFEISGNSEIYATFTEKTPEYNVSVTAGDNASATLVNVDEAEAEGYSLMAASDATSLTAADGEEIAVNAVADADYTIDAVYVNGEEIVGDNFILTEDTEVTLEVSSLSTEIKAVTGDVIDLEFFYATVSGSVADGDDNIKYIRYWKESEPDEVYVTDVEDGGGEYVVTITDLDAETTYCYQMNDTGEVKTFTTPEGPSEFDGDYEDPDDPIDPDNPDEPNDPVEPVVPCFIVEYQNSYADITNTGEEQTVVLSGIIVSYTVIQIFVQYIITIL